MYFNIILVALIVSQVSTAPVDDPVRIDLPVYNKPQTDTNVQAGRQFQPENVGGEPFNEEGSGGNFISYKIQTASNMLGNTIHSQVLLFVF